MTETQVDYSVYLVTDTPLVPGSLTLLDQVRKSIENGATVVQLREKTAETRDFVELAKKVHELTKQAGIPLIINDRLDVALAVDAEGIHVGQDDMEVGVIKKHFPGKIIGVSVRDPAEARQAIKDRVDYVGIGAVFGTATKELKKAPIGCSGVREILHVLDTEADYPIKSVAIGGINHSNAQLVLHLSATGGFAKKLDGVAIVSCIIASFNAGKATADLVECVKTPGAWVRLCGDKLQQAIELAAAAAPQIAQKVVKTSPLLHHITNDVVKNVSANMSIAVGASPAMSECAPEFEDFAAVPNAALLVNMGTATAESLELYKHAIKCYNKQGRTVVLDPVGCGASAHRRATIAALLDSGVFDVIKGNVGEIIAAAQTVRTNNAEGDDDIGNVVMRGVDSVGEMSLDAKIKVARRLARENHTVVLMTGAQDVLVDGLNDRVALVQNGNKFLGEITGSGCMLGSLVSAFATVHQQDPFQAALSALLMYTIASEQVTSCDGPGSFLPKLIDSVYNLAHNGWDTSTAQVTFR